MENGRTFKMMSVVALCLAVIGITIGFAAFSATLKIENASATVKKGGNDSFASKIGFNGTVTCTVTGSTAITEAGEDATNGYQKGTASGASWSGIKATLYEPGDKLTCTATVLNESDYIAYLGSISTSAGITCGGTATNVSEVCASLTSTVTTGPTTLNIANTAATTPAITGNTIAATSGTKDVVFTLEYGSTGPIADDDVTVTIPTISLVYDTAD